MDIDPTVTLRVPATSAFVVLIRAAVSAMCARLDFTIDRIEDVKLGAKSADLGGTLREARVRERREFTARVLFGGDGRLLFDGSPAPLSLSEASALLEAARTAPVLLVQEDAHYCIARSAGILGMGTNQVIRIGLDDQRRMCPKALEAELASLSSRGIPVTAVVACACATPIGAFDPLDEIADLCERYGVWFHVDAAHGAAAAFSEKYRHLVLGLGRADSLICDAHKMMHVPALCAFVFYKQAKHRFAAFQQDAPYLFDPSAPGMADLDCGLMTMECTKRAASFGLWGVWSTYGPGVFADLVDATFGLAVEAWQLIESQVDFEAPYRPQCNILVYRYLPLGADISGANDMNREIRRRLIESGDFYVSQTTIGGVAYLRMTVINPLTTIETIAHLIEKIRHISQAVSASVSA